MIRKSHNKCGRQKRSDQKFLKAKRISKEIVGNGNRQSCITLAYKGQRLSDIGDYVEEEEKVIG